MTFGSWLCFRLQAKWEEAPNLVDHVERATLSHWAPDTNLLRNEMGPDLVCR